MLPRRRARSRGPGDRPPAQGPGSKTPDPGSALDLLSDLLRILGETAFDLEELTASSVLESYERWARHLLVGSAPPGEEGAAEAEAVPLERRDFAGARRFAVHHRRSEHEYVRRSLAELRETIWTFIHGMGRAFSDDRAAEGSLKEQMARVRRAVDGDSVDEIRREAISAVGAMGRVIADRRRQQREQFAVLGERVQELRQELEAARSRMERDGLTGLYNRSALDEHLDRVADLATLFGEPATLFLIDIDHFKWVNDRFGHPTGDEVLRRVGEAIGRSLFRREDFVARYGGDELCAVMSCGDAEVAQRIGERLLQAVREVDVREGDEMVRVTASIGVAQFQPGEEITGWVKRADQALYRSKQAGRDCVRLDGGDGAEG